MRWEAKSPCGLRASRAAGTWPCSGAVKKSRSLMGRATRRCASRASPSRPSDTKLVLCRIILISFYQSGVLRRAAGPASAVGSALGGPPVARPGRTGNGAGSDRLSARRRCTGAVFLALGCPARGRRELGRPFGESHAIGCADPRHSAHSQGFGACEEDGGE
jgi:hypothetical protein